MNASPALPSPESSTEVDLAHVSRRFGTHVAVDDVSFRLGLRELTGVVGESGSGKSTLARMVSGLLAPTSGQVTVAGADVTSIMRDRGRRRAFRRRVQFIPQDTTTSFDPLRTLRDAVTLPARVLLGLDRDEAEARVDAMLDQLQLDRNLAARRPHEVSGGQRQRFAIARALIVEPEYLICDEIVSALDVSVQGSILNFVKDYCETRGAGVLFISHGLPATAFLADRIIVMRDGVVVEDGATDDVIDNPGHAYTASLVAAYRA
jgi:peptide/nickel transport system ATP-binding protein